MSEETQKKILHNDISQEVIEKIAKQSLGEISENRSFKQGKVSNWKANEEMYYSKKVESDGARANVDLGRMAEFVHILLSKIDNPLIFKFLKRKPAQLKRVERLNALRTIDADNDNWDIKDLVGKKQAIIYGRAIYCYYADSYNGYKAHLEPIDVYDFLIDKNAGGIDIEDAQNMGDFGLFYTKSDLEEGAKSGIFIAETVKSIVEGNPNNGDSTQEQTNTANRTSSTGASATKNLMSDDRFRFWRWTTTFNDDGNRYHIIMNNAGDCIQAKRLSSIFTPTKYFPKSPYPYWTWAAFPDLTEFWTPSYCDYVREIFQVQNVTINQMLDNSEEYNKPMKLVNVNALENLAELKYRKGGNIRTKNDVDVSKVVQFLRPNSIDTPIRVFDTLENIRQRASGVTDIAGGVAAADGKVGIYEGNKEAEQDRFSLLSKSCTFGYKRFSRLYEIGVRDNLTKKVAIEMIGVDGIEQEMVSRRDIFHKDDDFSVLVEASNSETLLSARISEKKIAFLSGEVLNVMINKKKLFEIRAKESGMTEDEIRQLLDTSFYGNSELMSECDRDIESILDGKDITSNDAANNAYKQKMVDFLRDHKEDMNDEMFNKFTVYIASLEEIIMKNEVRALNNDILNSMKTSPLPGEDPGMDANGAPLPLPAPEAVPIKGAPLAPIR